MHSSLSSSNLFKPIKVGDVVLSNRLVIPPLSRLRATRDNIPTDIMQQYYDERSKTPGSLVISEATLIAPDILRYVPGIYSKQQALAWQKIAEKVHENKSFLSVQIWSLGRVSDIETLDSDSFINFLDPSCLCINDETKGIQQKLIDPSTLLSTAQVKQYVQHFIDAAANAVEIANFDFVELHCAYSYLIDQFIQSITNKRTDEYGGSIENRARFLFEIVDGIIARIGISKFALRFFPWAYHNYVAGVNSDPCPDAIWEYIFSELEERRKRHGKAFGYISIIESDDKPAELNDWIFDIYKGVILRTGNYCDLEKPELDVRNLVNDVNANDRTLIGIGRASISNVDLIERLRNGQKLTKYQEEYFCTTTSKGYIDYPRFGENKVEIEDTFGKPLA